MSIFSIVFFGVCLFTATKIVNQLNLQHFFISIPYTATFLLIPISYILYHFFNFELTLPFFLERLAVTIFLFSIGFQIATIINKKYFIRVFVLSIISILIIVVLNLISLPFPEDLQILVGSAMFAYSPFIMEYVTSNIYTDFLMYWSSIQMVIVFISTPIFLFVSNRVLKNKDNKNLQQEYLPLTLTRLHFFVITVSFLFVFLTMRLHSLNVLFLHDFVFGLLAGFFLGYILKRRSLQTEKATKLHQLGSLGLYLFIMSSINHFAFVNHELFNWSILFLMVMKTILVGFLSLFVMIYFFKSLSLQEKLVATVAGWTFVLSSPVVCMHGMRTVVNKLGPAPYVLLIIPPIILWIVNYFHILIIYLF
ncbi:hypothetical protein ACOI1C_11520 [Bacillus sp. DJP31]|uniref:hypothetical protein n=1 Tax=Bacillus sp. DJP31 TaxID=3409789 RepID=UPI003BB57B64